MKTKIFTLLFVILSLLGIRSNVYAGTVTAQATGNWSAIGTWDTGVVPTSTDDVIVPNGFTVTIDVANSTCFSLTVQNGGIVSLNQTFYVCNIYVNSGGVFKGFNANSSSKNLYWGYLYTTAATPQTGDFTITNNGQFGGTASGTNDGVSMFFSELATNLTIDGSSTSTCYISRLIPNNSVNHTGSNNLNLNIKQNLYISMSGTGLGFSLQNNRPFTTSTTRYCTIFPGFTVTNNANARFHQAGSTAPTAAEGNIVYNIYGTFDLATNSATYFDLYTTSAASNTQSITVNLGNGTDNAILKLGRNINLRRYYENQAITLNWNNSNSKVVFGGNGAIAINSSGYYNVAGSAYVDDARLFPSSIRNLSYENSSTSAALTLPVKVSVTETLDFYGNGQKLFAGTASDGTARTVTLGKLFCLNNNAYVVTAVSTPLTTENSTTLAAAGIWVKGATLTDASGNQYYCDEFGLTAGTVNFVTGTGASGCEFSGAPINVTGNVTSTLASGKTARFAFTTIGGNVTNGAGTMYFAKNSTVGGTFTNNGTVTLTGDIQTVNLINNGTFPLNTRLLSITGSLSGSSPIDASTGYLQFNGNTEQTLSSANVGTMSELRIAAGSKLTTTGTINATVLAINSTTAGTGTLIDNGTLTATTANVKQYLPDARNWYISSPVTGAAIPGSGYTFYAYDETGQHTEDPAGPYWFTPSGNFTKGMGYIAFPTAAGATLQFSGTLNSGDVEVDLTHSGASKTGFNLIGNPYPCHLAWTYDFVNANSSLIESSIWTRTTTGTNNTNGTWSFATFNATSSESVPSVANAGIIPPMQAFWVKAKAAGTLTLDGNLTKSHQLANPFKAPALKKSDRQHLRLEISNGTVSDETLLYFDGNASNAYDAYDSPKFAETKDVQVYTTAETEKLVINGLNTMTDNMLIPLGVKTAQSGTFTLKPIQLDNMPSDTKVYLVDGQSQTELELNKEYSFTSDVSDNTSRFSLLFKVPSLTTQIEDITNNKAEFNVYRNTNGQLAVTVYETINATSKVTISNQLGQKLSERSLTATTSIVNEPLTAGVYFITVSSNGKSSTQKIIFN